MIVPIPTLYYGEEVRNALLTTNLVIRSMAINHPKPRCSVMINSNRTFT